MWSIHEHEYLQIATVRTTAFETSMHWNAPEPRVVLESNQIAGLVSPDFEIFNIFRSRPSKVFPMDTVSAIDEWLAAISSRKLYTSASVWYCEKLKSVRVKIDSWMLCSSSEIRLQNKMPFCRCLHRMKLLLVRRLLFDILDEFRHFHSRLTQCLQNVSLLVRWDHDVRRFVRWRRARPKMKLKANLPKILIWTELW